MSNLWSRGKNRQPRRNEAPPDWQEGQGAPADPNPNQFKRPLTITHWILTSAPMCTHATSTSHLHGSQWRSLGVGSTLVPKRSNMSLNARHATTGSKRSKCISAKLRSIRRQSPLHPNQWRKNLKSDLLGWHKVSQSNWQNLNYWQRNHWNLKYRKWRCLHSWQIHR